MDQYDHKKLEEKWQKIWEEKQLYKTDDNSSNPKFYALVEFPYPSGDGLHVGHPRPYIGMDIIARKKRLEGFNVLYPIGWDAFGLPTENYAIKTGISPAEVTKNNTDNFRRQIKLLGTSFDWSREINTTDPKYYKWTQWIFLQLYKHGLGYKAKAIINWCPKDKTGLANEEVINGKCERCGTAVEKREKEQWILAITKYAERLDKDLDTVDYSPQIKLQQKNWIGRSEGAEIKFNIEGEEASIIVFTSRPETIYGATYLVLSPEHFFVEEFLKRETIENKDKVNSYLQKSKATTEIERTSLSKEKTGVELKGIKAINPATKERIPVFVADYVLPHYGTGAIMAVPAHDERDGQFAKKYTLPTKEVIDGSKLINSENFSGHSIQEVKEELVDLVGGKMKTTYKLRDWIFSRQRYWGEPIPIIHCAKCGTVPVPEKDLPVELPEVENYHPTDSGESPLAVISEWVNITCPKCGGEAKRETDTMPNWAGSSWYFLRYIDPENTNALADPEKLKKWMPVDWYNGGMEHTTLHLLYSRFWNKFLFDIGVSPVNEPYQKRTSHGFILAPDGEKMSKSRGNVINPDDVVNTFGADTFRLYEMFMGPFDQAVKWSTDGILGPRRFVEKIWKQFEKVNTKTTDKETKSLLEKTIKKVGEDIESMHFNTAVSTLMILGNQFDKVSEINQLDFERFLIILAPFCPHLSEELWEKCGHSTSIFAEKWPAHNPQLITEEESNIVIQINGKMRGLVKMSADSEQEAVFLAAKGLPEMAKWLGKTEPKKIIYVPGRLLNIVI